jgi:hypothetical protein
VPIKREPVDVPKPATPQPQPQPQHQHRVQATVQSTKNSEPAEKQPIQKTVPAAPVQQKMPAPLKQQFKNNLQAEKKDTVPTPDKGLQEALARARLRLQQQQEESQKKEVI